MYTQRNRPLTHPAERLQPEMVSQFMIDSGSGNGNGSMGRCFGRIPGERQPAIEERRRRAADVAAAAVIGDVGAGRRRHARAPKETPC